MKVLLLENIDIAAFLYLEKQGYEVESLPNALTGDDLIRKLKGVTILGIRSKTKVTKDVLENVQDLKVIGAFCIGLDQVELTSCEEKNIQVFNAPFSNTRSVAELAIGEIIMLMRGVFDKSLKMHGGMWQKSAQNSFEIRGKNLGIIGYGNIGMQLSVIAEALGMNVLYFDISDKQAIGNAHKCLSMDELLIRSDVISVHVDGRKENTHLINHHAFKKMKDGVIFLNLSRGKIVAIDALAEGLKSGKVSGAAIDVFEDEPAKNGVGFVTILQNMSNVILTPHIAGSTQEAQKDIALYVSKKLHEANNYSVVKGGGINE